MYFPTDQFSSVRCSGVSNSLQVHGLEHIRLPCLLPSPRACSNSCPSSWWCHPTISSSVAPFSSYPQTFLASGSLPVNQPCIRVARVLELQHQSFQWIVGLWNRICIRIVCLLAFIEEGSFFKYVLKYLSVKVYRYTDFLFALQNDWIKYKTELINQFVTIVFTHKQLFRTR